jgi:RNA polymerase sigma factor (sigma-70 family)
MFIRTIDVQGNKSGWVLHKSRKQHREMLLDPPHAVEIRIRDFYANSPDRNSTVVVPLSIFNLLARAFFLQQEAEKKSDDRHIDDEELTDGTFRRIREIPADFRDAVDDADEAAHLRRVLETLTDTQKHRVQMYFFGGFTYGQIAEMEGVHFTSVEESVKHAIERLKNIF